jgi:hypothetical protein
LESGAGDLCGVDDTGCDEILVLLGRGVEAESGIALADLADFPPAILASILRGQASILRVLGKPSMPRFVVEIGFGVEGSEEAGGGGFGSGFGEGGVLEGDALGVDALLEGGEMLAHAIEHLLSRPWVAAFDSVGEKLDVFTGLSDDLFVGHAGEFVIDLVSHG